jgi:hypothetical protein
MRGVGFLTSARREVRLEAREQAEPVNRIKRSRKAKDFDERIGFHLLSSIGRLASPTKSSNQHTSHKWRLFR